MAKDNKVPGNSSSKKETLQNATYALVVLDFVISLTGGILKSNYPDVSEKLLMVGGIFLSIAVVLIIIELVNRRK